MQKLCKKVKIQIKDSTIIIRLKNHSIVFATLGPANNQIINPTASITITIIVQIVLAMVVLLLIKILRIAQMSSIIKTMAASALFSILFPRHLFWLELSYYKSLIYQVLIR